MFRKNTVSAQAGVVPSETVPDQVDNTFINGTVQIEWLGNVNGDGKFGFVDPFSWQPNTRVNPDNPFGTPNCDFDRNGKVGFEDLFALTQFYGMKAP